MFLINCFLGPTMYPYGSEYHQIGSADSDDGELTFDMPAGLPFFGTVYRNFTVSRSICFKKAT